MNPPGAPPAGNGPQNQQVALHLIRRADGGLTVAEDSNRRLRIILRSYELVIVLCAKPSDDWSAWHESYRFEQPLAPFGVRADAQGPIPPRAADEGAFPISEVFATADGKRWCIYAANGDPDAAIPVPTFLRLHELTVDGLGDPVWSVESPERVRGLRLSEGASHQDIVGGWMEALSAQVAVHPPGPQIVPAPMPHCAGLAWGAQASARVGLINQAMLVGALAYDCYAALANLELAVIEHEHGDKGLEHLLRASS